MNLDFIAYPLGTFLHFIFNTLSFHNYGLAIIIFTIIIRLVLLPLNIKQYRSTAKMQEIQPLIQEIQKRYKNDKEKLNQEMMKVYQENQVNPAGGCLPLLVQMPILIALYWVISSPLKFMLNLNTDIIKQLALFVEKAQNIKLNMANPDLNIISYFSKFPEKLSNFSNILKPNELVSLKTLNLEFLPHMNLGVTPSWHPDKLFGPDSLQYWLLLLIPLLAGATTFIQSKLMTPQTASQNNPTASSMQNSMLVVMPIMTLLFAFSFPAGLGLYWIAGNVIQIFIQLYMNKYIIGKKKEVANK